MIAALIKAQASTIKHLTDEISDFAPVLRRANIGSNADIYRYEIEALIVELQNRADELHKFFVDAVYDNDARAGNATRLPDNPTDAIEHVDHQDH